MYYFGEDVDLYKGSQVIHEGAWREGVRGARRGMLLPGVIRIGDRYYQEQAPGVGLIQDGVLKLVEHGRKQ